MNHLNLPQPIADYFEADNQGTDTVVACFTPQAVVIDEGQMHKGLAAIAAWKTAASSEFSYAVEPIEVAQTDGRYVVTGNVSGAFPGSPVQLRYSFDLAEEKIARLEIAP